ncbi:MAG: hypothetical protein S4CHLAM37_05920 [Chlamydiia bacterium]|nr:hypothetical protein [Chlamydiia bacterium]
MAGIQIASPERTHVSFGRSFAVDIRNLHARTQNYFVMVFDRFNAMQARFDEIALKINHLVDLHLDERPRKVSNSRVPHGVDATFDRGVVTFSSSELEDELVSLVLSIASTSETALAVNDPVEHETEITQLRHLTAHAIDYAKEYFASQRRTPSPELVEAIDGFESVAAERVAKKIRLEAQEGSQAPMDI